MGKRLGVYSIVWLLMVCNTFAQDGLVLVNQYTAQHDAFFVDQLEQVYFISGSVLWKLDKNGNKIAEFSDEYHNTITWVDVQDPYDVLVYYDSDNRVFLLDNMLNPKGDPFYLNRIEIDLPTVVAQSLDYNFWVFDPYYLSLVALDEQYELVFETKDISHFTKKHAHPNLLFDTGQYIIANDPTDGVLVFDEKGAYVKKFAYPNLRPHDISVSNGTLYLKILRSLFAVNIADGTRRVISLTENAQQVVVVGNTLYHSNGELLTVYSGVLQK